MLPVSAITDNQILGGRVHLPPVRAESLTSFVLPSKTRPELGERHRVTFDSSERPSAFSCTCEAYARDRACWAAARALDVLVLLMANNVTVGRPGGEGSSPDGGGAGAAPAPEPEPSAGRFEACRGPRAPEREGDPEAVLVAPVRKVGGVERVRGFQI